MNRQGVAVQALSLTAPMVYWADGASSARRLARDWNDGASAAHIAYPDRFVAAPRCRCRTPTLALAELDRAARLPGIRGVYMGTNVGGRELSDPAFFPVFERCQALGLPVLLHPFNVIGAERLEPFYLTNLLGNPFDTGDRGGPPRLRRRAGPAAEAGGDACRTRAARSRWSGGGCSTGRRCGRRRTGRAKKPFSAYLRRFTYDTISHDPGALRYLVDTVGADRVMLGTDFCFDMGYERPLDDHPRQRRQALAEPTRPGRFARTPPGCCASARIGLGACGRVLDRRRRSTGSRTARCSSCWPAASRSSSASCASSTWRTAPTSCWAATSGLTVALRTQSFALALLARRGGHRAHRHGHGALLPAPAARPGRSARC